MRPLQLAWVVDKQWLFDIGEWLLIDLLSSYLADQDNSIQPDGEPSEFYLAPEKAASYKQRSRDGAWPCLPQSTSSYLREFLPRSIWSVPWYLLCQSSLSSNNCWRWWKLIVPKEIKLSSTILFLASPLWLDHWYFNILEDSWFLNPDFWRHIAQLFIYIKTSFINLILLKQTNYDQLTMYDLRLLEKARLQAATWHENMKMSVKQRWPRDFYIWWDFEHKNHPT